MDFNISNHLSKTVRKNKRSTIDLANVVYDEEFVSLINSLSTSIKNYYSLTLNILKDLYNNSISIDNNLIYSKCLINEINYNTKEKIKQLEEKIDSISNTKKIFEKNILLIHSNLNKFFNDSKLIFKNLKNIRNSKINCAIDLNKKMEKYGTNNSMINLKTSFDKNDLLLNQKENDRYYNNISNSLTNDKPLSSINFNRNKIFHMKGNSTENNKRHKLKSIYFNNNFTINGSKLNKHDSFKLKNKLIKTLKKKKENQENNIPYKQRPNNIQIGNLNHIFEFSPDITKTKSSYNNFYINQNSNINLNSNNINNINNNNLELSYKVIEFLSLLTNITKNNSKNNPNMQKMIQNFEKTKKNLFELSKKYIEHNNLNESKIYSRKSSSNSTNENAKNNKISNNEMQLILMNNNIENIKKGIEYKELIEKINYLSNNVNKLEKQNKHLSKMYDNTKKELINNTLLLSKKNNQLNSMSKEKTQFISKINVLQKDNDALMELIQEKNKENPEKEIKKKENQNTKEINLIKQKDKIINDLKKKINELDKKYLERNNETKNLNDKIKELNDSLKYYKNVTNEKQNLIQQLQLENKNKMLNVIEQQNIKNSITNYKDLIFEQLEELEILAKPKSFTDLLNIEEVNSFNFIYKKIQVNKINNNNSADLSELENKINELNSQLEKKDNDIRKYKNENSILKTLAKSNKNKEENEDENLHQLEEEINQLKSENKNILDEKNILEEKLNKLISDNKNFENQLNSKNSEIKNLENNIKELEEQLKESQLNNIQKIYNEQEEDLNLNNNKIEEEEIKEKNDSRNDKKNSLMEADTEKNSEVINQLKEELKEKENLIEYLKIEIQELKSKNEENDDNFMDSSLKNSELTDKYNTALEEKVKFLSEKNEYYQKLYNEDKLKLQNLENINNQLKIEIEQLKNNKINKEENKEEKIESKNDEENISDKKENETEEKEEKEEKMYSLKNYNILCDKVYGELRWFLLVNKVDSLVKENDKLNYDELIWVPKINIIDLDTYKEPNKSNNENKKDDTEKHTNNKIYKNEIHINRDKEISFSNNYSFNNNSEELNKNKQNNNNNNSNNNLKLGGSFFSLGNNTNIVNEENNIDNNKLMEKYKLILEKLSKTEEKNNKLKKKNNELKEKIMKINKNNSQQKITLSDDSNNYSNCNDVGKLSIVDNNFDGEGDIIGKLNNQKEREQEYFEQLNIEIEANKNQLKVVKEIFKELEKKFETVKKICENLFSRLTLKKKEKEEFKVLLKVMDFSDEQIALIIDKRKK